MDKKILLAMVAVMIVMATPSVFAKTYEFNLNVTTNNIFSFKENATAIVADINFSQKTVNLPYKATVRVFTEANGQELKSALVSLNENSTGHVSYGRLVIIPNGTVIGNITYFLTYNDTVGSYPNYDSDLITTSSGAENTYFVENYSLGSPSQMKPKGSAGDWIYDPAPYTGTVDSSGNILFSTNAGSCSPHFTSSIVTVFNCSNGGKYGFDYYYAYTPYMERIVHNFDNFAVFFAYTTPDGSSSNKVAYYWNATFTAITSYTANLSRGILGSWGTSNYAMFYAWKSPQNRSTVDLNSDVVAPWVSGILPQPPNENLNGVYVKRLWLQGTTDAEKIGNVTAYWEGTVQTPPTFLLDNVTYANSVVIVHPTDGQYLNNANVSVNYKIVNASEIDKCWFKLNAGANTSITCKQNFTILGIEGANNLTVAFNTTTGDNLSTSILFFVDTTPPTVTITVPANTTYNTINQTLEYSASDLHLDKCKYEFNGAINVTLANCNNTTFISSDGSNVIKVFVNDSAGNSAFDTVFFSTHNASPIINIVFPTNGQTLNGSSTHINYTVTDLELDKCWYVRDGNLPISLPNCVNFTVNMLSAGGHTLRVYANDSIGGVNFSEVNFTMLQGFLFSAFLPNGNAISNWNMTIRNSTGSVYTVTNLNNPALTSAGGVYGVVTVIINKNGYDNETIVVNSNDTMDLIVHNFTLYPISTFEMSNILVGPLSNWFLDISFGGTSYISTNVSTSFEISNRFLTAGNNTFSATASGYTTNTSIIEVVKSVPLNINFSTKIVTSTMFAFDEITRAYISWNAEISLGINNFTALYVTGYRNVTPACIDNDASPSAVKCFIMADANGIPANQAIYQIWGQDWNNATYNITWGSTNNPTSGSSVSTLNIYAFDVFGNKNLVYTGGITNPVSGQTLMESAVFTVNNENATYPKSIKFELNLSGLRLGGGANGIYITEFRMVNNTAGYYFISDTVISIPNVLLQNYGLASVAMRGEETYNPAYTQQRYYYVTTSVSADYNIVGYLLRDVQGYYQQFLVQDRNGIPVQGAEITIGKWFNQIEATLAQCRVGLSGQCVMWLRSGDLKYSTRVIANGFVPNYNQSTPYFNGQGQALIYMTTTGGIRIGSPFTEIFVSTSPTTGYQTKAFNATCNVSSVLGSINFVNFTAIRIYGLNNFSVVQSLFTNSNPTGTSMIIEIKQNGRYGFSCGYEWVSNATTGNATVYYKANSFDISVFGDNMQDSAGGAGLGNELGVIIALGIIIIVCIPIGTRSPIWAVLIAIFLLVMFTFVGMIPPATWGTVVISPWGIVGLVVLVILSIIFLRSFI